MWEGGRCLWEEFCLQQPVIEYVSEVKREMQTAWVNQRMNKMCPKGLEKAKCASRGSVRKVHS